MAVVPDLQLAEAVAVDWTEADYFGDRTAITRSSLWLLARNPRAFYQRWILGLPVDDTEETKQKRLGTWTHFALLQPDELVRRMGVPVIPKPERARKGGKPGSPGRTLYDQWEAAVARREAFMSQIPDRIDLSLADVGTVTSISQSVWSHPEAYVLLSAPGRNEQTVLWREPTSGLLVKVRMDRLAELGSDDVYGTDLEDGPAVVDLKTTRDHTEVAFARSIENYGYLDQAALYTDAGEALLGQRPAFYFVAAKNESNWGTAVYRLNDRQLERGRESYRARLREVNARLESGDWLAECERGVRPIRLRGDRSY